MFNSSIAAPVAPVIDDPDLDEEDLKDEDPQDEEEEYDDEKCFYDDDDDDDEYGYGRRSRGRYLRWLNDDGSMSAYERNL